MTRAITFHQLATPGLHRLALTCVIFAACSGSDAAKDSATSDQQVIADGTTMPDKSVMPDRSVTPDLNFTPGLFGDACSTSAPCEVGLHCLDAVVLGGTGSFCTKTCTTKGQECPGAPGQSRAFCSLEMTSGTIYCSFLCQSSDGTSLPCPPQLQCSANDLPAGSGQHLCVPK